jgi:Zn-dependent peptidase ImmA (M78 family)
MGVTILDFHDVEGLDPVSAAYLVSAQGDEWSAVTVHAAGKQIVVVNPRHSEARQASNIMHELAHIIRGHKPAQVERYESYALRGFKQLQENEADWLAGCLLLPRKALLHAGYNGLDIDRATEVYGVSKSLYKYRIVISGASKQLRYYKN